MAPELLLSIFELFSICVGGIILLARFIHDMERAREEREKRERMVQEIASSLTDQMKALQSDGGWIPETRSPLQLLKEAEERLEAGRIIAPWTCRGINEAMLMKALSLAYMNLGTSIVPDTPLIRSRRR
ncbi:MAG: hypothetical protein HYV77_03020 [Candidatus Wildermuthbacteria bacterium]|nr:hypothetical protein [Candidatus Wildermuthbacteria bacterium]